MVKAELLYNPYTLETEILFNGQPPRINSLVEKYKSRVLQDWIKDLPLIFHDEMNGYDFELEFSGTKRDFAELDKSFRQAGVSDGEVKLFHKSELEDRDSKCLRIKDLLKWLEDNPNRNFDNEQFRKDNELLFDGAYSIVSIQGADADKPEIDWAPVAIEIIKEYRELDNTDLTCTPIVINVDEMMIPKLQHMLRYLFGRPDVVVQQIFFRLKNTLNRVIVYRMIKDLGIKKPHIIESFDDEKLKKYFEIYPVTDYIIESYKMFSKKSDDVNSILEQEREQGEKTNTAIDKQLHFKDEELKNAQEADEVISSKVNIDKPAAFTNAKNILYNKVTAWRKKKTKTTEKEEAEKLAQELETELIKYTEDFMDTVSLSAIVIKEMIDSRLADAYKASGCCDDYGLEHLSLKEINQIHVPDLKEDLMKLNVKENVRKGSISLFYITSNNPEDDYELQTAYYLQKWREHIFSLFDPLVEKYMYEWMEALTIYNDQAIEAYHEHLMQYIVDKIREEELLAQQLSSEEKQLQQDISWLNEFKKQLKLIARG